MTTPRPSMTAELSAPEPDDVLTVVEPWVERRSPEELEYREHLARDTRPLGDYFERMRERGLLD